MDVCGARHEGSKGQDANSIIYCMFATQIVSPNGSYVERNHAERVGLPTLAPFNHPD